MKRVFKYQIGHPGVDSLIKMPARARIAHFGVQATYNKYRDFFLWAEVGDDDGAIEERNFFIAPTGFEVPDEYWYMATTMDEGLVWHLFEKFEDDEVISLDDLFKDIENGS